MRFRPSRNRSSRSNATGTTGWKRMPGMRFGPDGGVRNAKVVDRVALQEGEDAPDTAIQVALAPSMAVPFMNCSDPIGLAPGPAPVTAAGNVSRHPEAIFVDG